MLASKTANQMPRFFIRQIAAAAARLTPQPDTPRTQEFRGPGFDPHFKLPARRLPDRRFGWLDRGFQRLDHELRRLDGPAVRHGRDFFLRPGLLNRLRESL